MTSARRVRVGAVAGETEPHFVKKHRLKKARRHRIFAIKTNPQHTSKHTHHRSLPHETNTIRSARYTPTRHFLNPYTTPISATDEAHRKGPIRQYHHHNVRPEPVPVVGIFRQQPRKPAAAGDTATARREEGWCGQQEPGRRFALCQPFRCHHEPCEPETVFVQAEADQQVRICRLSHGYERTASLTLIVATGTAATRPVALSSPATCLPLRTPMKNPSRLSCLRAFVFVHSRLDLRTRLCYLYD